MTARGKPGQADRPTKDAVMRNVRAAGNGLEKLNRLVDWQRFRPLLAEGIRRGERPPFDEVLMFKVLVLKRLHDMTDDQVAYEIVNRLTWCHFLGLLEHDSPLPPDEVVIRRFSEGLAAAGVLDRLWQDFDSHLAEMGIGVNKGRYIPPQLVPVARK